MQVRARHGDWDSAPVLACNPEELPASRTGEPFSTGHPLNLPGPLPRKALHALGLEAPDAKGTTGRWEELADVIPLPARVQRMLPIPGGACVLLADATWLRVTISQ